MDITANEILNILCENIPEIIPVIDTRDPKKVLEFLTLLRYSPPLNIKSRLAFYQDHCPKVIRGENFGSMNCTFGCDYYGPGPDGKKRCNHPEHYDIKNEKILKKLQTADPSLHDDSKSYDVDPRHADLESDCKTCKRVCDMRDESSPEIQNCIFYDEKGRDSRRVTMNCPKCNHFCQIDELKYGHQKCPECLVTIFCKGDSS